MELFFKKSVTSLEKLKTHKGEDWELRPSTSNNVEHYEMCKKN